MVYTMVYYITRPQPASNAITRQVATHKRLIIRQVATYIRAVFHHSVPARVYHSIQSLHPPSPLLTVAVRPATRRPWALWPMSCTLPLLASSIHSSHLSLTFLGLPLLDGSVNAVLDCLAITLVARWPACGLHASPSHHHLCCLCQSWALHR